MEKRTSLFLVLSMGILLGYLWLQMALGPPPPGKPPGKKDGELAEKDPPVGEGPRGEQQVDGEGPGPADPSRPPVPDVVPVDEGEAGGDPAERPAVAEKGEPVIGIPDDVEQQWISLGSFHPDSPYQLLAIFNNQGATLQRLELVARDKRGKLRYRDLRREIGGYLGELALTPFLDQGQKGCRVGVVGMGTPADRAGIEAGDIVVSIDGQPILMPESAERLLGKTKPGDTVEVVLLRRQNGQVQEQTVTVELSQYPLQLIRPEYKPGGLPAGHRHSFRTTLQSSVRTSDDLGKERKKVGEGEMEALLSGNWEVTRLEGDTPGVEFRFKLPLTNLGREGALEFIKRFHLVPSSGDASADNASGYHLELEVEVRNLTPDAEEIAYILEGPNGLTTEGWWYSYKVPQGWGGVGARDLIYNSQYLGHQLIGCASLYKKAKKRPEGIEPLFTARDDAEQQTLRYIGIDTQYFNVALLPANYGDVEKGVFQFDRAVPKVVGDVTKIESDRVKTANTSFSVVTPPRPIEANGSHVDKYVIFAGPKRAEVLDHYGLGQSIEYGWFPRIAKPLAWILHFFYSIVGNYGLAIILLTVLVRGAMLPFSRKAALNAKMMQELAPEMKKIAEKYKKDMQKRAEAQRELYRQHNFNPLSGCFLMLLQLPIFLGLYRSLCVDVELRQAALIPGLEWCSNLAGPDQLWRWESVMPAFLASETGWLGPYFNILPIITIVLFLVQQKLFTPPPADDQQVMQQKMMKYMMVFIGVLFFKVASGLCLYFIASSLWGIAERKLLPKVELKQDRTEPKKKEKEKKGGKAIEGGNGAAKERAKQRRKQRKRQ